MKGSGQDKAYISALPQSDMHIDIPGILSDLTQLVDRMAATIEWRKLGMQEHPPAFPNSFSLPNHLDEEMRDLQVAFLSAAHSLREALDRSDLAATHEQVERWQQQLEQLEARASNIMATDRFIKS